MYPISISPIKEHISFNKISSGKRTVITAIIAPKKPDKTSLLVVVGVFEKIAAK